ncbi:helix-turn-helix domain-containing protein [Acrocarpospora catenulata]|uniref:helix-turn-helix domain-containing protein n=1 Tax=Acrocarpospora catenulata TaxID=2836182 RepID=UPI001BD963CA|nr:helix-turn-helix transcriptional regulator [Acrocarpospora catenulata]
MSAPTAVEDLATYLRQLKDKTGRSYDALAKRLNVGKSTLHRYCSGEGVPPRFTLLEQFAKECQASQAEIIELHQRWVRAQTVPLPEAEFGAQQRVETPLPDSPPPVLRKTRTWWTLAGLTALLLATVLIWRLGQDFSADAETAHHCTERSGVKHVDARQGGHVWTRDFVCANRPDTPLYLDVDSTEKVAVLDTPKSWFVCWRLGRVQGDGGRVWYYTRGDRAEPGKERWEGWGFVGSEHVDATIHPLPNMPQCDT